MRVLVVEDQERMAAGIRRGLQQDGVCVDVTGRGEDALWMAAATPYEAIVLAVMLPGIDGFETWSTRSSREVCSRTPTRPLP